VTPNSFRRENKKIKATLNYFEIKASRSEKMSECEKYDISACPLTKFSLYFGY
jgi:hypothetical protein